ncbi:uncharacterized protein ARB_05097 [Trichophyton benhamiae CBS 112371]|uniref:ML-like domain-containing protein n=1 Tax=Arthroderma benhamiae (strain ATCC MYA-4681 / CBS 112371) TaxID=663331 RepID=D4ALA0_ARTBC|nr:uncharacterized protein ARB_05097 [Trichophyton benhamiae CBS 112371]EFE36159.1 hypothetical protein ARB_05097 [Trichophyton benhamiae CBS 112371]
MKFISLTTVAWAFMSLNAGLTLAGDVLKNNGFNSCLQNSDIEIKELDFILNRASKTVTYNFVGMNIKTQNVTATITILAYGQTFTQNLDPCSSDTFIDQLCPGMYILLSTQYGRHQPGVLTVTLVPAGRFTAKGQQPISEEFGSRIPSIAFMVPDLDAEATLKLNQKDDKNELSCIKSTVGNGHSLNTPMVSYAAAGISGAALVFSGAGAVGGTAHPGAPGASPSFIQVMGVFQAIALNGLCSVDYPPVYRSFTKNFSFSLGLFPWTNLQQSIDNFRNATGGNLTENSVNYLRSLQVQKNGTNGTAEKRSLDLTSRHVQLLARDIQEEVNNRLSGIKKGVEELSIPAANTFMTVLLIFAIVIAVIAAGILLGKVVLEVWALYSTFPERLSNFRQHYWGFLARTITNLILLLYGIWTLYCIFQFTRGDSWAAKTLAAVTLALFTGVLGYFTFRIWSLAQRLKKTEGTASALFEDKEAWRKYSLFYDHYKKDYWWIFVPVIVYLFARGCVIAGADGHGLAQSAGQFVVEGLMLILLLWTRPFETKSGRWINISIQVVRVLSVACIIVFVDEFGISKTTKTVTGVALLAVQTSLAAILGILILINGIMTLFGKNPHEERHKEKRKHALVLHSYHSRSPRLTCIFTENFDRDLDNLTPLDPRGSILLRPKSHGYMHDEEVGKLNHISRYEPYHDSPPSKPRHGYSESTDRLVQHRGGSPERPRSAGSDISFTNNTHQQNRSLLH